MVPVSSIIVMVVNALLGFAIPIFLVWWAVKKHHAYLSTILIGAGVFVVFALVLESIVHQVVLKGPSGEAILGKTLYYALYGGLMAGLFEETGRFLAMKFLLKKEPTDTKPGVAYGLGHGGVEMVLIFGISMISTLTMAIMVNLGQTDTLLSSTPAEAQDQLTITFEQLKTTSAGTYLLGLWERLSAITLQVALSILVWAAARKGGKWLWLFPVAILLHALVDGLAVILSKSAGMVTVELIVMALAIAVAALAWVVARRAFPAKAAAATT
ncbi:MAG: YhfC family intramembrane metalloprotease [Bacteroidales bacterium]|nr:YhfC family intramembrane metalloprotease [Bacteroidales bacterium]